MLLALTASAKMISITPTSPREKDNIRYAVRDSISADTILVTAGTYAESASIEIKRNVVIMAAEGAEPVVELAAYTKLSNAAIAKIIGLKFDGKGTCEYAFRPYDNSASAVTFEGCEFTGFVKYVITTGEGLHTDSCIINNCYFHDNGRAAVYFPKCNLEDESINCVDYVKATNSTFANFTALNTALIDLRNHKEDFTENVRLVVDHCTFYNWVGDNRAVMSYKSPLAMVTNCIFAEPSATEFYGTYCYGGEVKNCLTFNMAGHRDWDNHPTMVANITGDPLFADAANADFTLGDGSPALDAGTDGSNLGDPRWWPVAPAGCNWDAIGWLGDGSAEQTFANQFKLCVGDPAPTNVATANIQTPGFATASGIYLTFPSAGFSEFSLDASQYDIQGAGIIFHLAAFTAKETEVSLKVDGTLYTFTIYNDKGSDTPTAIDNNAVVEKAQKFIENGQLFIIKNGVRYNAQGAVVK